MGDETSPDGNFAVTAIIYSGNGATPNVFTGETFVTGTIDIAGANIPVSIMNPYLIISY